MTLPPPDRSGWFREHPAATLVVAGVLLPNAVFLAGALLDIGTPPRAPAIALYLLVALLARVMPMPVVVLAWLGAVAFDLTFTLATAFRLHPFEFVRAFRFAGEVNFVASPLYAWLGAALALSSGLALLLLARGRDALRRAALLPALAAALALSVFDYLLNSTPEQLAGLSGSSAGRVASAALESGFDAAVRRPGSGRDALLVIVEGMGAFVDERHRDLVEAAVADPGVRLAYEVTRGTVPFFGSTTAAELRELCASPDPYETWMHPRPHDCLPAALARQGRGSIALHAYHGRMFDRRVWWPVLGFQTMLFAEDLQRHESMQRRCGGVWIGVCDTDIGSQLPGISTLFSLSTPSRTSGRAGPSGPADTPGHAEESGRLIYWLTLNTHVPIKPGDAEPRFGCEREGGPFGHVEVCRMSELWAEVFDKIALAVLDPRLRPAEVLVVGDHAPPLFSRRGRRLFVPGQVGWVRLIPR